MPKPTTYAEWLASQDVAQLLNLHLGLTLLADHVEAAERADAAAGRKQSARILASRTFAYRDAATAVAMELHKAGYTGDPESAPVGA